MPKKLAIGTWAYCFGPYQDHPVLLPEVIQRLSRLRFDGLELAGFRPHAHPDDFASPASRRELKRRIADAGLEVCGYAADFSGAPPGVASLDDYAAAFAKNLQFCQDLGIPKIRVDTVTPPPDRGGELTDPAAYQEHWAQVVRNFQAASELAQQAAVGVVWEFEPGFVFSGPSEIQRLVADVGHPNFSVLFDTCHAQMCAVVGARQRPPRETLAGGIPELIRMLSGHIGHIHLIDSDNTLHGEETSTHAPFGLGVINFEEVIPALLAAGYTSEWWSVDLCFWPQAWDVTAQAKQFLTDLAHKYG